MIFNEGHPGIKEVKTSLLYVKDSIQKALTLSGYREYGEAICEYDPRDPDQRQDMEMISRILETLDYAMNDINFLHLSKEPPETLHLNRDTGRYEAGGWTYNSGRGIEYLCEVEEYFPEAGGPETVTEWKTSRVEYDQERCRYYICDDPDLQMEGLTVRHRSS